jgi:hypothetical protein
MVAKGEERAGPPPPDEDFKILRLQGSYETFGVLIEYLAQIEPFSKYDLGNFAGVLQRQLRAGDHLAALTRNRMVGYCGWLPTTAKAAAAWQSGEGTLGPLGLNETADAVVLTVVAARDSRVTTALVREARRLNPRKRVYFKREYVGGAKPARKRSVQNVTEGE